MATVGQWLRDLDHDSRLEGELLLAERLNRTRSQILAYSETPLSAHELDDLQQSLARVQAGEPLAYLLGSREFWGLEFEVNPDVLIPRPETELLVELVAQSAPAGASVLELGTGSGAIAIALASERTDLVITATDISAAAIAVAERNACRLAASVTFIKSGWFDAISGRFDVIVSNPPYIREDDPHLPALHHEPILALVAPDNGCQALDLIASQAAAHLQPQGLLMLEHGFDQGPHVCERLTAAGFSQVQAHQDLTGHHRATSGRYL